MSWPREEWPRTDPRDPAFRQDCLRIARHTPALQQALCAGAADGAAGDTARMIDGEAGLQ